MDILMKLSYSPFAAISAIIIGLQYLVLAAGLFAFMISVVRPTTLWTLLLHRPEADTTQCSLGVPAPMATA
jgi:hypothetical protein